MTMEVRLLQKYSSEEDNYVFCSVGKKRIATSLEAVFW
jgi:hypothetical protein